MTRMEVVNMRRLLCNYFPAVRLLPWIIRRFAPVTLIDRFNQRIFYNQSKRNQCEFKKYISNRKRQVCRKKAQHN